MAKLGRYCKAYLLSQLRAYPGWSEQSSNVRAETPGDNETPRPLTDDTVVYVQENHVVTDGIYTDENVLFDEVTPEWIDFCRDALKFAVPDDIGTEDIDDAESAAVSEA